MPEAKASPSLREFVDEIAALGWLKDVDKPVDKDWEIACIARLAAESTGEEDAYAIRFNDVIGHGSPVVVGLFSSRRHVARSLGTDERGIWKRWSRALDRPIDTREVDDAPVKEVVVTGEEVDLRELPIPVWTPGRDQTPYISTACVITADCKDRIQNVGTYRVQLKGQRKLGLSFGSEKQHGALHRRTWEEMDKPTPVALVVGTAPAVSYAAAAKTRYGVDELTIAGGLLGHPVPVVRCNTVDLVVPAESEIVIEGILCPGVREPEGPFGEALGYMEGVAPAGVIDVKCVTHRHRPIFHGLIQQLPPSEGHLLMEVGLLGSLWHYLTGPARVQGLEDMAILPGAAGVSMLALSVRQGDRASATTILKLMERMSWGQKVVLVVDDDIDVRDWKSVAWALSSRVDFSSDIKIEEDSPAFQKDPATIHRARTRSANPTDGPRTAKMVIDATLKGDSMAVALPSADHMRRVRDAWNATGLPPLKKISRLERLLDRQAGTGIEYRLPRP